MSQIAEETVKLLNLLGQCYHGYKGFDNGNEIEYDKNDKFLMNVLETKYEKKHYEIDLDEYIIFETWFLEQEAKKEVVYDTVILKYPDDYWTYGKPCLLDEPSEIYEWYGDFNSKPYIKINSMYEKITISSKLKGSSITIEDILFATRGMCLDGWRYVVSFNEGGGYKLKERMGNNLLVLEPGLDNFST
jgi:hypothetical protein